MERSFLKIKTLVAFFFATVILFGSCRENTIISSKLSPANDTARIKTDTLYTCVTHTFFDDKVITSTNYSGLPIYEAIGSLTDSFFGTMTAATYFQINPPSPGFIYDTSYHIDSVVLVLPYSDFTFGDTSNKTVTQTYQAFYLADTLGFSTTYGPSAEKRLDYSNPLSGPITVNVYNLRDSVNVNGIKYHPALRMKLNTQTIKARINAALSSGYNSTTDKTLAFIDAFKGICVKPADINNVNKSAIPYFRLDPAGTDMYGQAGLIVYHHGSSSDTAPKLFSFAQSDCAHFNGISKAYSRFPFNNLIHSTKANDEVVAVQNKPGASIDIKIGGITNLIPKGVAINKADLQISVLSSSGYYNFAPPDQLYPVGIASNSYPTGIGNGIEYSIEDRKPEWSLSPYQILDGTSHTFTYGTTNITTYTIGIPREVMASIAAQNDTLHLHIHGTQVLYGAYRMLAAGGNYPDSRYKTKLIVVHSSLKN